MPWIRGIPEDSHAGGPRNRLLQELQTLPAQLRGDVADAGDVAARAAKACDESIAHRVTTAYHHDRNGAGFLLDRVDPRRLHHYDGVEWEASQLGGELRN